MHDRNEFEDEEERTREEEEFSLRDPFFFGEEREAILAFRQALDELGPEAFK